MTNRSCHEVVIIIQSASIGLHHQSRCYICIYLFVPVCNTFSKILLSFLSSFTYVVLFHIHSCISCLVVYVVFEKSPSVTTPNLRWLPLAPVASSALHTSLIYYNSQVSQTHYYKECGFNKKKQQMKKTFN